MQENPIPQTRIPRQPAQSTQWRNQTHPHHEIMKTIIITVSNDGNTTVEAKGFSGRTCVNATQEFERALGTVDRRRLKREYYAAQIDCRSRNQQGQGRAS